MSNVHSAHICHLSENKLQHPHGIPLPRSKSLSQHFHHFLATTTNGKSWINCFRAWTCCLFPISPDFPHTVWCLSTWELWDWLAQAVFNTGMVLVNWDSTAKRMSFRQQRSIWFQSYKLFHLYEFTFKWCCVKMSKEATKIEISPILALLFLRSILVHGQDYWDFKV